MLGISIALLVVQLDSGGSIIGWTGTGTTFFLFIIALSGFFTLQPNEARVLVLFGSYKGTVRTSGFHWTNPFNSKLALSYAPGTSTANASR